jgi:hypothetical protein
MPNPSDTYLYPTPVASPKMFGAAAYSTEEENEAREVTILERLGISNETRDEAAAAATSTTEQLSIANEIEILRSQLAPTKAQLNNDATSELTKVKQQNKQLETAAHILSLELITDANLSITSKTEELKDISNSNNSSHANAKHMVEETSDLGAASIWIVDNCDIILNW